MLLSQYTPSELRISHLLLSSIVLAISSERHFDGQGAQCWATRGPNLAKNHLVSSAFMSRDALQSIQQSMEGTDAKLNRIADFGDKLKELKTRHSMTVKQNADAYIKLQVSQQKCICALALQAQMTIEKTLAQECKLQLHGSFADA